MIIHGSVDLFTVISIENDLPFYRQLQAEHVVFQKTAAIPELAMFGP